MAIQMRRRMADPVVAEPSGAAVAPVAYVMSRFPKLTETFVLDELGAVHRAGLRVELFPLIRERGGPVHPAAVPWVARATYLPFLSPAIVRSNISYFARHPRRYLGTLVAMLRGTAGSLNFFLGGVGIFAKVVHAGRLMTERGVGHVHCHFANHPALAGFLVHRLYGIPYSFTAHGSDLHVDRTMLRQKVAEAAFVVTVSRSNAAVIESEVRAAVPKLHVIHCGIDGDVFAPTTREAGSELVITCVGTLHEVKGQRYLIEAVAQLAEANIPFRLQFVGDGPDRGMLEALVGRLRLGDRVQFCGLRTREEVVGILGATDVLVAPSVPTSSGKREGLPVVLIEAAAAGVPMIASHLSGIPELVDNDVTGLTVPPGDVTALANALTRLALDPGLRWELAVAARQRVAEDFDLDRNARRLIGLFAASAGGAAAS
jgi:colanic acid/amylovoran biosynthesis glycosyltransferase